MLSRILRSRSALRQFSRTYAARGDVSLTSLDEANVATIQKQAPNRVETWAKSQKPRREAMTGPRFEQKDLTAQPAPYAAIELIAEEPIRYISNHIAVCDGESLGYGQGHPKVFINLDKPEAVPCTYCGTRYALDSHKAIIESS
ncbi:hypothetical protein CANCADRAFT_1228 [Tortispora caseinolytica NRRL Y-17796]|uniref:Zinc finger CHCC-type domain-containing protein n=1 Tax=Tortispora caseinolytica NRRL Y-17796 TaxID=767744 RepID=A0A1E4TLJ5_9ASCO|nr:hypothetical protein CANCADRAFT_1228 [Tortispora caseinolytica NRRL Y-17796]